MEFEERVYGILVVSSSKKFIDAFSEMLPASSYDPVDAVCDLSSAKRAFAEKQYDFVVVNSPLRDDSGVRFAIDAGSGGETVAMIIAGAELYAEICDRAAACGVFALPKPTSQQMILTALKWMSGVRERARLNAKKALSLEEKMEEIRHVNRAKWLLIEKRGMDEPTAHRFIEKRAMDLCVTRRAVADEIIEEYK